jgi:hypothetical protein
MLHESLEIQGSTSTSPISFNIGVYCNDDSVCVFDFEYSNLELLPSSWQPPVVTTTETEWSISSPSPIIALCVISALLLFYLGKFAKKLFHDSH